MSGEVLSRPVWSMLNGPQSELAMSEGKVARIDPRYGPFAAAQDTSAEAQIDLSNLVQKSMGPVWLVEPEEWPAPAGTQTVRTAPLLQMVASVDADVFDADANIAALDEQDAAEMAELALATEPGPWGDLTHRYGQFYGIRDGGRLAAMAGERMRPGPGLAEVSGVCTWPEYRGRGMARRLISHVMNQQRGRGDAPFLHSYAHNDGAIALYQSLGFRPARKMVVTVLTAAERQ
ncbi:MAG: GNAT family N-acetyltransferase [Erythrobacter sp.]